MDHCRDQCPSRDLPPLGIVLMWEWPFLRKRKKGRYLLNTYYTHHSSISLYAVVSILLLTHYCFLNLISSIIKLIAWQRKDIKYTHQPGIYACYRNFKSKCPRKCGTILYFNLISTFVVSIIPVFTTGRLVLHIQGHTKALKWLSLASQSCQTGSPKPQPWCLRNMSTYEEQLCFRFSHTWPKPFVKEPCFASPSTSSISLSTLNYFWRGSHAGWPRSDPSLLLKQQCNHKAALLILKGNIFIKVS